jgi:hypothetical protein
MRPHPASIPPVPASWGRVALALILVLAAAPVVTAQPELLVTFGRSLEGLRQSGSDSRARQTTDASIVAEHHFADDRARIFYTLDAGTFSTEGDWKYFLHSAGLLHRVDLGSGSPHRLFVSAWGTLRNNGTAWAAADYRALGAMANVELKPAATTTIRFGYRLDARDFTDLPDLDQVEHEGFLSLLKSWQTRTTLVGEVYVGGKSYAGANVSPVAVHAVEGTGSFVGRGMGPGLRGRQVDVVQARLHAPGDRAGLVTLIGRVAQSLADRTAIILQVSDRTTFGQVPPVVVTTPALFFDDGIYDDPFSSDARTVRLGLKQAFANGSTLEGAGSWTRKRYNSTPGLDLAGVELPGGPLRDDRLWRAEAGWSFPLMSGRTGPLDLGLLLHYGFVMHESNDAFYNYRSHGAGFGFSVGY